MSAFQVLEGPFEVRFDDPDLIAEGETAGVGVYLLQAGDSCWDISWVITEPFVDVDDHEYELTSAIGNDDLQTPAFQVSVPWRVGVKVKNPPEALAAGRAEVMVLISRASA